MTPTAENDAPRLTVLEAALAAAWDEGYDAGHRDARAVQPTYPDTTPNPYRVIPLAGGRDE